MTKLAKKDFFFILQIRKTLMKIIKFHKIHAGIKHIKQAKHSL